MVTTLTCCLQLLLNLLRKDLAQLDTPLVEGVDVPDGSLGEGHMLVVGDQRTESSGCDLLGEDGGRRAVTKEGLVRHQVLGRALSLDLLRGLADHQSLRLGKEVGCQHALVLSVLNRVVRLGGHEEVRWNKLGTLVEQLEEAVLGVGGGLTEQDRAGGILDVFTSAGDGLSVALHRKLLEVCGETVQVLVERCNKVGLSTKEVTVPHAQKTTEDRDVLFQRSLAEVGVHGVSTGKELVEVIEADVESNGETNGAPYGVATTNPGLKPEHVLCVNSELGDLLCVGRESNEVLGDVRLILCLLEEPCLGRVGVSSGLGGGECLGGNQEERGLRV